MSVVAMVLLAATVIVSIGLLVAMFTRNKPLYGALGVCLLSGPGTVLTFVYIALAGA